MLRSVKPTRPGSPFLLLVKHLKGLTKRMVELCRRHWGAAQVASYKELNGGPVRRGQERPGGKFYLNGPIQHTEGRREIKVDYRRGFGTSDRWLTAGLGLVGHNCGSLLDHAKG